MVDGYVCQNCQESADRKLPKCSRCGAWGSYVQAPEVAAEPEETALVTPFSPSAKEEADAASDAASDALAAALAEAARMKENWIRTEADLDNVRKRAKRELEDRGRVAKEDLLKEILPAFDDLYRTCEASLKTSDMDAVVEGLELARRASVEALRRAGVTSVATVGQPFDPAVHEAVQEIETADHPPGTVAFEARPGYLFGGRLVRAATVVVAKAVGGL
jgi:molecular chaperone GrpE